MNYVESRRAQLDSALPAIRYLVGDAAQGGGLSFILSELAFVEAGVFERKYAPLLYQKMMAISTEGGAGVTSFVYRTLDAVGQGKRVSNRGDDIPLVNTALGMKTVPVALGGIAYDYSTEELRQAAMLRIPLPSYKAQAALRAFEYHMNKVALVGEGTDLMGLLAYPGVPVVAGTNTPWIATTTFQQFMQDINNLLSAVYQANLQNEFADTLLVPPSCFTLWTSSFVPQTGVPLLQLIAESNFTTISGGGPLMILQVPQLETAGASSSRRIIAYNRGPDNVVMHIPMPLLFLPPQPVNLNLKIPGEYKYSGVELRYLNTIRYMDTV